MQFNKILFLFLLPIFCNGQTPSFSTQYVLPITAKSVTPNANSKFILFWGQSNCTGAALNAGVPGDLTGALTGCNIFNGCTGNWELLQVGVNNRQNSYNICNETGFGIELRTMQNLHANYSCDMYMYKFGQPSSCLYPDASVSGSWGIDMVYTVNKPNLYHMLYFQAVDSLNLAINRFTVNLQPNWLIWMQGENDANGGATQYNAYQTNLTNFINALRTKTGQGTNLKVCLVSLSSNQTAINALGLAAVNTAMTTIAGSLTNVYYVSQNSSVDPADNIHYNAAGYNAIALLVAAVIIAH